jgi:hypothetical protein
MLPTDTSAAQTNCCVTARLAGSTLLRIRVRAWLSCRMFDGYWQPIPYASHHPIRLLHPYQMYVNEEFTGAASARRCILPVVMLYRSRVLCVHHPRLSTAGIATVKSTFRGSLALQGNSKRVLTSSPRKS